MAKTLKEIVIEYANTRGGGLPVTPEEMCNALTLWVQEQFSDEHIRELFPNIVGSTTNYVTYNPQDNEYTISVKSSSTESADLWAGADGLKASIKEQWIKDNFFNAIDLSELFEGSDTVVVDLSEDRQHIEIHLDGDVVNKIERAILTPMQAPIEDSVPIVGQGNSVSYLPVSEVSPIYQHSLEFDDNQNRKINVGIYTSHNEHLNDIQEIVDIIGGSARYCFGQVISGNVFVAHIAALVPRTQGGFYLYAYKLDGSELVIVSNELTYRTDVVVRI